MKNLQQMKAKPKPARMHPRPRAIPSGKVWTMLLLQLLLLSLLLAPSPSSSQQVDNGNYQGSCPNSAKTEFEIEGGHVNDLRNAWACATDSGGPITISLKGTVFLTEEPCSSLFFGLCTTTSTRAGLVLDGSREVVLRKDDSVVTPRVRFGRGASASDKFRIITLRGSAKLTLEDITLEGGSVHAECRSGGGAVNLEDTSTLIVHNSLITRNEAGYDSALCILPPRNWDPDTGSAIYAQDSGEEDDSWAECDHPKESTNLLAPFPHRSPFPSKRTGTRVYLNNTVFYQNTVHNNDDTGGVIGGDGTFTVTGTTRMLGNTPDYQKCGSGNRAWTGEILPRIGSVVLSSAVAQQLQCKTLVCPSGQILPGAVVSSETGVACTCGEDQGINNVLPERFVACPPAPPPAPKPSPSPMPSSSTGEQAPAPSSGPAPSSSARAVCTAGHRLVVLSNTCEICPPGRYSDSAGSIVCHYCPRGRCESSV